MYLPSVSDEFNLLVWLSSLKAPHDLGSNEIGLAGVRKDADFRAEGSLGH